MRGSFFYREVLTFAAMAGMQSSTVVINTLFKAASMEDGLSEHVFVAYSYAIASILLLPFVSCRSSRVALPSLTFPIMCRIGLLAVTGCLCRILGFTGLYYSSPTLSSAIGNLNPAFTFILAVMFRMEKVVMSSTTSQAKIWGTVVSIAGAFVITFYKGPPILLNLLHSTTTTQNWVIGGSLITLQNVLGSLWSILLAHIMDEYPAELTVIFIYNTLVSAMSAVVALIAEGTSSSAWILNSYLALAAVACCGVFGSCLGNAAEAWVLPIKGPVYVAMFTPFAMVMSVVGDVTLLGQTLHVGSLVGAVTISIGFYMLIWGKAKEQDHGVEAATAGLHADHGCSSSSTQKVPFLLQDHAREPV